jgi:hypothetical protein
MNHPDILVTAASIIAGFGSAVIAFRLERELDIEEKNEERPTHRKERHWIPVSDWLVVVASVGALCFVVAPLVAAESPSDSMIRLASAVCSAAAVMLGGYIPSILAHYHFIYGLTEERTNPTFWEGVFVFITLIGAVTMFRIAYQG